MVTQEQKLNSISNLIVETCEQVTQMQTPIKNINRYHSYINLFKPL